MNRRHFLAFLASVAALRFLPRVGPPVLENACELRNPSFISSRVTMLPDGTWVDMPDMIAAWEIGGADGR